MALLHDVVGALLAVEVPNYNIGFSCRSSGGSAGGSKRTFRIQLLILTFLSTTTTAVCSTQQNSSIYIVLILFTPHSGWPWVYGMRAILPFEVRE